MILRAVLSAACALLLASGSAQAARTAGTARHAPSPEAQLPLNYRPAPDSDEAGLWMMSDEMERAMQTSPLLVRDPALNAYVKGIVCKLVPDRCDSIRIYILDIPYFNAAMAPNGAMQVWTGLLLRAHDEAQLAFILGHEISHYTLRHTVNQWRRIRGTSGFITILAVATGGIGGLAALAAVSSLMAYSRDEESEADSEGLKLAAAAGYSPGEGAAVWRAELAEEKADPHPDKSFSFLRTHPATEQRLAAMESMAGKLSSPSGGAWNVGVDDYHKVMEPLRGAWLEEDLALGRYEQSLTLMNRLIAEEPASGQLQFYLGEAYRRRNAPGDADKAVAAYRAAIADTGAPAAVYRGLGLIAMKAGDKDAARTAFQQYLTAAPSADDRAMVEYYLSHL